MSDCQFMRSILSDSRYVDKRLSDSQGNYRAGMREKARSEYGARVVKARERAGLTQIQLAKRVGMAQSSLGQAETTGVGSAYTPQIAVACNVSAEWLATGEGSMLVATSWPGKQLTLEQIHTWSPEFIKSVEDYALFLLSGAKAPPPQTVPTSNNVFTADEHGNLSAQLPLETKKGRTGGKHSAAEGKRAQK